MKKLLLLILISQTACPMLALIKRGFNQVIDEFANDFKCSSSSDLSDNELEDFLSTSQQSKQIHKEQSIQEAAGLAIKNNQLILFCYYQQLEAYSNKKKIFISKQTEEALRAKHIKESQEEGFIYISSPRSLNNNSITE